MHYHDLILWGESPMKKAFAIASVSIWTIGLVLGLGFAVAGEVTAINDLPAENQQLKREHKAMEADRDSMAARNAEADAMNNRWSFQNGRMIESLMESRPWVTPAKPGPREE